MDGLLFDEYVANLAVGGLVASLGLVFLAVQQRTRATIGLAIVFMAAGLDFMTIQLVVDRVDPDAVTLPERLQILLEAAFPAGLSIYMSGLLATTRCSPRAERVIRAVIWSGWGVAAAAAVLGLMFPAERANVYLQSLGESGAMTQSGFWMFGGIYLASTVSFVTGWIVLARQQVDPGEHARFISNIAASPFMVVSTILSYTWAVLSFTTAILIVLVGLFRFSAAQGERGAFLSRFLSPQVLEVVRLEGLGAVTQAREVDITVVCCDLRGFTAYAEAVPSQAVIDLLGEYYDSIGDAVAEVRGTIKDFAGDGILVLVGAPLARSDHAGAGLELASRILERGHGVTDHWATGPHPLGLGVGVASGRVTVGGVGSTGRTEYTAVGAPVNLAARLCAAARDGEILVDQRTVDLAGVDGLSSRGAMQLKGLATEIPVFALETPAPN